MKRLYIPTCEIPQPNQEYVAWVDIMGTKNIFRRTDPSPTVYILKLHQYAKNIIEKSEQAIKQYPVIDGFYITHESASCIVDIVTNIFILIKDEFIKSSAGYQFLVRAGLSYGSVIHGEMIDQKYIHTDIKDSILFGKAVVDATIAESGSPPFSITVSEDSRNFFINQNIHVTNEGLIRWFDSFDTQSFIDSMNQFYQYRRDNPNWVEYSEERMTQHQQDFLRMMN